MSAKKKFVTKWKATEKPTKQAESVAEFLKNFTVPEDIIVKNKKDEK